MASPSRPAESARNHTGSRRIDEIQGLRAVAVLLVVIYHMGLPLSGGFVGVDVFFVISGYVITRILWRELRGSGRLSFATFYGRRVRRLLPAAALMLTVTLLLSAVIQSPVGAQQDTALAGVGAAVWLANAVLFVVTQGYFAHRAGEVPLEHTWSLAVEEQFYLVFPAVLALSYVLARRVRLPATLGAVLAIGTVGVVSFAISLWLGFGNPPIPSPQGLGYFAPFSRAWEFAAGSLIALVPALRPAWQGWRRRALGIAGLAVVAGSAATIEATDVFPGYLAVLPVLGTALMIAAAAGADHPALPPLASRPMVWIGDRSYSWYLWHWPLIVFVHVFWPESLVAGVAAGLAALAVADLSLRYVENPIRHRRHVPARRTVLLAAAWIGVPIILSAALYTGATNSWGRDKVAAFADQVTPKSLASDDCLTRVPIAERDLTPCTFNGDAQGAPVLLVGDSNAASYADGLVKAAEDLDRPVIIATVQGCPLVDVKASRPGETWDQCHDLYGSTMSWLADQRAGTVVIASANEWVDLPGVSFTDPESDRSATSRPDRGDLWSDGLLRTFADLEAAGHAVVQLSAVPHFETSTGRPWGPEACSFLTTMRDPADCGMSLSRSAADERQQYGLEAETRAARTAGIEVVDVRDVVCSPRCSTNVGSRWLYRDGAHITVDQSLRLTSLLRQAVRVARG